MNTLANVVRILSITIPPQSNPAFANAAKQRMLDKAVLELKTSVFDHMMDASALDRNNSTEDHDFDMFAEAEEFHNRYNITD